MTLRELLSCYDENCPLHMMIYDREWKTKELKIHFNPGYMFEWLYEDDMEELDKIADCKIIKWYIYDDRKLRVILDTEF